MGKTYSRYYIVFEDQIEHIGREFRRRFPGREGQRHPLVGVIYTREEGRGKQIVSLNMDYVAFDEDGKVKAFIPVIPASKGTDKGSKVVRMRDYRKVNLTDKQRDLLVIRLVADFGEDAWLNYE